MHFENINALWGLLFIPIIILMYILKQNFEKKEVSSTFLWDLAMVETKVNTPWQRLKNNILMLIQILVVILIVIALLKPSIIREELVDANKIIVIDNTASMRAKYKDSTRLEYAKKLAINSIKSSKEHTPVTLLTVGDGVDVIMSNISDKQKIQRSINGITLSIGTESIEENYDFIKSVANNYKKSVIELYTDDLIEGKSSETILVNSVGSNVSLDYINSFYLNENNYEVMAKVTNRYKDDVNVTLDLYDEQDVGINSYELSLKGYESKNIILDNISTNGKYIYGELNNNDLISEDNIRYSVLSSKKEIKKILMVSKGNTFLEKAILATKRYELYKTNDCDNIDNGYDLYIFDGMVSDKLPEDGAFIFINIPEVDSLYKSTKVEASKVVSFNNTDITKYISEEKFYITDYYKTDMQYDESIANVGKDTVIGLSNIDGKNIAVVSFDLYNSNLPTTVIFPIWIDRLIGEMVGDMSKNELHEEGKIVFKPMSTTVKAFIEDPTNNTEEVLLDYPVTYYDNLTKLGIYTIIQEDKNRDKTKSYVGVDFPITESNIYDYDIKDSEIERADLELRVNHDIIPIVIFLLFIVAIYEWKKYWKG